jgi:hypothetical protein
LLCVSRDCPELSADWWSVGIVLLLVQTGAVVFVVSALRDRKSV